MSDTTPRPRLGRGLSALLGDDGDDYQDPGKPGPARDLPIEQLHPGRFQPRTNFDEAELTSLVDSIREKGILQPILVRSDPVQNGLYEIIAGERRWRAAQRAQLHEVPVIIRDLGDQEALEVALIENIQRANLSPIEEAEGYQRLMDGFNHTQEALASAIGKSRSHIANTLRLLTLPGEVRQMVDRGELTAGHARSLVGREDAITLARQIVIEGLTVRDIEARVGTGRKAKSSKNKPVAKSSDTLALERDLTNVLGLKVTIRPEGGEDTGRGILAIEFKTFDQLDDVLYRLNQSGKDN
ncbi:MAG: chromosome partitioning protein ParB [Alphaproteobacteria bacterium]|nr:chromosome partitioning protein ParB [Alphaproteobacteria bacterium]HCP00741.1 chromosome partitioning protein ParB [Rhodospirillaceae bacterium]